jgi:hypothetical protein
MRIADWLRRSPYFNDGQARAFDNCRSIAQGNHKSAEYQTSRSARIDRLPERFVRLELRVIKLREALQGRQDRSLLQSLEGGTSSRLPG